MGTWALDEGMDVQRDVSERSPRCREGSTGNIDGGHYIFVCSLVVELIFSVPSTVLVVGRGHLEELILQA